MDIQAIRRAMEQVVQANTPAPSAPAVSTRIRKIMPKGIYECPKCDNQVQVNIGVFAVECMRHREGSVIMVRKGGKK